MPGIWRSRNTPIVNHGRVSVKALNGVFRIARTGAQWRGHGTISIPGRRFAGRPDAAHRADRGTCRFEVPLSERGHDSDFIRDNMKAKGGVAIIPARRNRETGIPVDAAIAMPFETKSGGASITSIR